MQKSGVFDCFGPSSGVPEHVRRVYASDTLSPTDHTLMKRFLSRGASGGLPVDTYVEALAYKFGRQTADQIWDQETIAKAQEDLQKLLSTRDKRGRKPVSTANKAGPITDVHDPRFGMHVDSAPPDDKSATIQVQEIGPILQQEQARTPAPAPVKKEVEDQEVKFLTTLTRMLTYSDVPAVELDKETKARVLTRVSIKWIQDKIRRIMRKNLDCLPAFLERASGMFASSFTKIFTQSFRDELKTKLIPIYSLETQCFDEWFDKPVEPEPEEPKEPEPVKPKPLISGSKKQNGSEWSEGHSQMDQGGDWSDWGSTLYTNDGSMMSPYDDSFFYPPMGPMMMGYPPGPFIGPYGPYGRPRPPPAYFFGPPRPLFGPHYFGPGGTDRFEPYPSSTKPIQSFGRGGYKVKKPK